MKGGLVAIRRRPAARAFLSLLLAVVLLACHGAFGVLHQFSGYETRVGDQPSAVEPGASSGGHHSHGGEGKHLPVCPGYAAVIFVVLLGTALVMRLADSRMRADPTICRYARRGFPTAVAFHLARGPTAPALQVFRL